MNGTIVGKTPTLRTRRRLGVGTVVDGGDVIDGVDTVNSEAVGAYEWQNREEDGGVKAKIPWTVWTL